MREPTPDLILFNKHVNEAGFQIGVDKGMWGIVDDDSELPTWPFVFIWIKTAEKQNCPDKYTFRFDLTSYPASAPTACPWDIEKKAVLAEGLWPKGNVIITSVFKPSWKPNGLYALYAPCDRLAMAGHDQWKQQHKDLWWKPSFKIEKYLHYVHRLLNSSDYANY